MNKVLKVEVEEDVNGRKFWIVTSGSEVFKARQSLVIPIHCGGDPIAFFEPKEPIMFEDFSGLSTRFYGHQLVIEVKNPTVVIDGARLYLKKGKVLLPCDSTGYISDLESFCPSSWNSAFQFDWSNLEKNESLTVNFDPEVLKNVQEITHQDYLEWVDSVEKACGNLGLKLKKSWVFEIPNRGEK